MEDRFKLRVWDNVVKKYLTDDDVYEITDGILNNLYDLLIDENRRFILGNHNLSFEQCTGLKDKNGKLIYEGDIVRYKLFHEDYLVGTYLNKVTFNHGSFTPICNRNVGDVEVIGNIHENPELLEG